MKNIQLLNPVELETAYPKQEYLKHAKNEKLSDRVKEFPLHFQIGVMVKDEGCIGFAKKNRQILKSQDAKLHHLTPLMLAIVMGRPSIAKEIASLMNPEELDLEDEFHHTALHLASFVMPILIPTLLDKKANPSKLTPWNGYYNELLILTGSIPPPPLYSRFKVMDDKGNLLDGRTLTSEKIKSLLGRTVLRERPIYDTREGLIALWQKPNPDRMLENVNMTIPQLTFIHFYCPKLREYYHAAPQLLVKSSLKNFPGLGLFADQIIEPLAKISEYGGRYQAKNLDAPYLLGNFNGEEYGGLATLANCGFPNSMIVSLPYEGSERLDLYSIKKLLKGEEILYSYGPFYPSLSFGKQALLGVLDCESFFKNFHINHFLENIEKRNTELKSIANRDHRMFETIKSEEVLKGVKTQAPFPLYYPNYLFHLWLKKITKAQYWIDALNDKNSLDVFGIKHLKKIDYHYQILFSFIEILKDLEMIKTKNKSFLDQFRKWSLNQIGVLTFLELRWVIILMLEDFVEKRTPHLNLENYFDKLIPTATFKVYEDFENKPPHWLKDQLKPMS